MLSGLELIFALAIVFAGATITGTVGFGMGLVVAPFLLLFVAPQSTVVMVNSLMAILLFFVLVQTRSHLDLRRVGGMALGGLAAVPIGVLALDSASPVVLRLTIALVILGLAPLTILNVRLPFSQHPLSGPAVGFLTSLSVTTLGIGGPLAAIYVISRQWPPQVIRASLAFYFMLSDSVAFVLYTQVGLVHWSTVANIGILLPSLIAGFGLATLAAKRMNARIFRFTASVVIIAGGAVLLGREILRL